MSTSSIPSPLNMLKQQHNRSKTTVSSSDTDVDSAGYASSSGTTTPEDDTQTFYLGPTFQPALADKSQRVPREKLTIATKQRNITVAMKKVKKAVHALVAFKRKRPDDISPILISSPLRERFGKRMSIKSQPDESFYTLPNRRFSFSDVSAPPVSCDPYLVFEALNGDGHQHHSQRISRTFGTISGSTPNFVVLKRKRSGLPSFPDQLQDAPPSPTSETVVQTMQHAASTFRTNIVHGLRILLFVPWCTTVGGAALLFPSYVELVAFRTGYLESPKGVRRFAHWAECGQQHVMIFLASLIAIVWYDLALGLSLTSIVLSRLVFVWHRFEVDKSIPLGENDQQSLYLVMTGLAFTDGTFIAGGMKGERTVSQPGDSVEEVVVAGT